MVTAIQIGLLLPLLLGGAGRDATEHVRIERLSGRVLLAYWIGTGRCNLTAIQSEKGLVLIDSEMSPRIMAPIKEQIEKVFGRNDWAYVINTHAHDNHAGGNCLFKDATIIGHENLPKDMEWLTRKQTEPDWKRRDLGHVALTLQNLRAVLPQVARRPTQARHIEGEIAFWQLYTQDMEAGYEIVEPTVTFSDTYSLDLGDLQLELVFFGRGHSLSDTLIYVPQEKLLVSGAIIYQRQHLPEIGEASQMEDVQRYLAVLDRFLSPEAQIDRVVPSHSPPLRKRDLAPVRDYYQRMLAGVRRAQREGLTLRQATDRLALRTNFPAFRQPPPGDWAHGMHERNLRNLWRIVQEERRDPQDRLPND